MKHPYAEFEGTRLWKCLELAISDLEANGDLQPLTSNEHLVGFLCKYITDQGLVQEEASAVE